jgi:hypothetical protein
MLNVNPETICFLIDKARVFHAREDVVIDDLPNSPADDWGRQALADHLEDPTVAEFISTFKNLEPDQQQEVVALMWLGRGDFDKPQWKEALSEAERNWTRRTAEYLLLHPMLADHLTEGLDQMGYSCNS